MNSKALELTITALVVIVLGLVLLIGMYVAIKGSFSNLKDTTEPFLDTALSTSIKEACSIAGENSDKLTFCCQEYEIDSQKIKCSDSRLEISQALDCQDFQCE